MRTLAFVLSGVAAGIFSGALGVGGALLATPLIRFLGVSPYLAVGTTVPVLLPTALVGAWTYGRAGLLDPHAAGWTALGGVAAALAGALTTRRVNGHVLMLVTGALIAVLAFRALTESDLENATPRKHPRHPAGFVGLGVVAGFLSGLLGIGGGFVMVPAFIRIFRLPVKVALGSSLAVIAVTAIPNMVGQWLVRNIDWEVALYLAIGVIPGARIGSLIAIRSRERTLRIVIAIAVIAIALIYAWIELTELFSS